jgi:hypothetical protein
MQDDNNKQVEETIDETPVEETVSDEQNAETHIEEPEVEAAEETAGFISPSIPITAFLFTVCGSSGKASIGDVPPAPEGSAEGMDFGTVPASPCPVHYHISLRCPGG